MKRLALLTVLLVGCTHIEPLDLPADPAETGVPVGVRTMEHDGLVLEVWYPARDDAADEPTEDVDFMSFVPDHVSERLGEIELPLIPSGAVRDSEVRPPEEPYPVVVFSHGLGGTRVQSVDFTVHLASRGYVVVATDHAGRALADLLPCIFSPPLAGCQLGGEDPAPPHVDAILDWVDEANEEKKGVFEGILDTGALGLSGHSAGGWTTTRVGEDDAQFDALLPMAGGGPVTRDVPLLRMAGTCDYIASYGSIQEEHAESVGDLLAIAGAGHLAFSDFCTLDLGGFAEALLEERDDLNTLLLAGLVQLGTDGCPEAVPDPAGEDCPTAWLPLEESNPVIRYYATVFFDEHLRGTGPGVQDGVYDVAAVNPAR
ncbi:MAG: hypothetical protein JRJ84_23940 [Deltaproteobacteria bacterium]|nr:hypothetical protein [Deltaproteobacteria bacterium]